MHSPGYLDKLRGYQSFPVARGPYVRDQNVFLTERTGKGVMVAVIDSGVHAAHPPRRRGVGRLRNSRGRDRRR
mgnify:CR=1 FL=1